MIKELVAKHLEDVKELEAGTCFTLFLNPHDYELTEEGELTPVGQKLVEIINARIEAEIEDAEKQNFFKERFLSMFKDCLTSKKKYQTVAHFISEDFEGIYYHLPLQVEEQMFIGDHFLIEPLFYALLRKDRYVVVVLSEKNTRFLEGVGDTLLELQMKEIPRGFKDVVSEYELKTISTIPTSLLGEGDIQIIEKSIALQKESLFIKYVHKLAEALEPILEEYVLNAIVIGTNQQIKLFKENTELQDKVIAYLSGVYDFENAEDIAELVKGIIRQHKEQLEEKISFETEQAAFAGLLSRELPEIFQSLEEGNGKRLILNPDSKIESVEISEGTTYSNPYKSFYITDTLAYYAYQNKIPFFWTNKISEDALLIKEW